MDLSKYHDGGGRLLFSTAVLSIARRREVVQVVQEDGQAKLASELEASFAAWASSYVLGELQALPGLFWLGWPVSGALATQMVGQIVTILAKSLVMRAMLALQAEGAKEREDAARVYVEARDRHKAARAMAGSKEDIERAETAEMVSFVELVRLNAGH